MVLMEFEQHTTIDLPANRLDVPKWLFGMTDREYQRCAKGHRAAGTFVESGTRGMVNVESIGGHLLVQHYREDSSKPSEVVMVSPKSRIYLTHVLPATLGVRWVMSVTPVTDSTSRFTCRVELEVPAWMRVMGLFAGMRYSIQAHVDEETIGYAQSLARSAA
ncbi:hypothetical protein MAAFP003_4465 [Mycobacterium ahvazicum]|uniref:SRPBCC family protein n=1 Tax=Mycobacterium ahvazicum TaxID=1964395 RepID=A0A2K4YG55_9MYCO|nr:hypothetical protein [Mycobacterium ahvazicum]SOX55771.1 hypothetical protein MAAFP003_4465 [Mycobacterium ahvazicum]